jgi:TorA maturation chaperone TorD
MSVARQDLAELYAELGRALLEPPAGDREAEVEFYRLFFHPSGAPCQPWQSVFETAEGDSPRLMGPAHHAALAWYRRYGFEPALANEPADHLGLLLLFYARLLAAGEDSAVLEQFEREHLAWARRFAACLGAEARHPRYRTLARRLAEQL